MTSEPSWRNKQVVHALVFDQAMHEVWRAADRRQDYPKEH